LSHWGQDKREEDKKEEEEADVSKTSLRVGIGKRSFTLTIIANGQKHGRKKDSGISTEGGNSGWGGGKGLKKRARI